MQPDGRILVAGTFNVRNDLILGLIRLLPDGRLEVTVQLRNRENRRLEVQANCVFKDVNGISTGDETPFQTLILTENATEQVKFTSMNDKAKRFTIRVRQAR